MLETSKSATQSEKPQVNRRSVIVLGIVVIAVAAAILVNVIKAPGMLDAQGTADAFFHSLTSCDKIGVQKYSPVAYKEGTAQLQNFENSCAAGAKTGGKYAYIKDYGDSMTQKVNDKTVKAVDFEYSVSENGQSVALKVEMLKTADDPWQVAGIVAAPTS